MKNELTFALYAIKKNIESSAELRTSFLMNIVGMMINNLSFVIIWIFFVQSVGVINGWTAADVIGLQGFTALAFSFVFTFFGGLPKIAEYISSGAFDRFMLSPKNLILRIATSHFMVPAAGDFFFGVICLTIYAVLIQASILQVALLFLLALLGSILFFAVLLTFQSVAFFFTDGEPLARGLFEMFLTPALFHGGAFQGGTRLFFTFLIPSLLLGALPVEIIRDLSFSKLLVVLVVTLVWLFISVRVFYLSVKKYESSNFMTFGG